MRTWRRGKNDINNMRSQSLPLLAHLVLQDLPPKYFKLSKTELPSEDGGFKHRAMKAISHEDHNNLALIFIGSHNTECIYYKSMVFNNLSMVKNPKVYFSSDSD